MKRKNQKIQLNGEWDFCIIDDETMSFPQKYTKKILVPYCPESELSGIAYKERICKCWYKKELSLQRKKYQRCFLHIGASDYETVIYINKKYIGRHFGGYTPIDIDITDFITENINVLEICVIDDMRDIKCSGKQTGKEMSYGCFYTRVTGIWQDVFAEYVPNKRITSIKLYPNVENSSVSIKLKANGNDKVEIRAFFDGRQVGFVKDLLNYQGEFTLFLEEKHLWEIGQGSLYDIEVLFGEDIVTEKFGLREVKIEDGKFFLNGKSVFQRLVLDQGYYPDGIYTPETKETFVQDIDRAIALGFNGARLHQKAFDPAYLEEADKRGFLVWGEYASWGMKYDTTKYLGTFIREWDEMIERDFNHPSIICWCPLNEVWNDMDFPEVEPTPAFMEAVYDVTKSLDNTRPCIDVSGGYHGEKTDVYDYHCYEGLSAFKKYIHELKTEDKLEVKLLLPKTNPRKYRKGEAVQVSEFGGIRFSTQTKSQVKTVNDGAVQSTEDWGYGKNANTEKNFVERYKELVNCMYASKKISGFCYTQLYDVEQEKNGFYTYNRMSKISQSSIEKIKKINKQKAKIEE